MNYTMARPKEPPASMSAAFEEKCGKELDKLKHRLAKQLKDDMLRLLETEEHCDATLTFTNKSIPVHSILFWQRCPTLAKALFEDFNEQRSLENKDEEDIRQVLRYIYSEDSLEDISEKISEIINKFCTQSECSNALPRERMPYNLIDTRGQDSIIETDEDEYAKSPDGSDLNAQDTGQSNSIIGNNVDYSHDGGGIIPVSPTQSPEKSLLSPIGVIDKTKSPLKSPMTPSSILSKGAPFPSNSSVKDSLNATDIRTSETGANRSTSNNTGVTSTPVDDADFLRNEGGACELTCKLAGDLLALLESQMGTDIVLIAGEYSFTAHRFILTTRSTFFSAMLGGSWQESSSGEIKLEGVSGEVLRQMLLYMYGGLCCTEGGVNLTELVATSDMYGLEGMRDTVSYLLKKDLCHFFHKPCTECIHRLPEALMLSYTYGLTDVHTKCMQSCCRYFTKVWPSKPFAALPDEMLHLCLEAKISDINHTTVIDIVLDTDKVLGGLPSVRWSEPVVGLATKLMDACVGFLQNNLVRVIQTPKFKSLGKTMALGLDFLESVFSRAMMLMPYDKACNVYMTLIQLLQYCSKDICDWTEDFQSLISSLHQRCKQYCMLHIKKLVSTYEWNSVLTPEVQKELKEGAWYVSVGDERNIRAPPKLSSSQRPKPSIHDKGNPRSPRNAKTLKSLQNTEKRTKSTQKLSTTKSSSKPPKKSDTRNLMIGANGVTTPASLILSKPPSAVTQKLYKKSPVHNRKEPSKKLRNLKLSSSEFSRESCSEASSQSESSLSPRSPRDTVKTTNLPENGDNANVLCDENYGQFSPRSQSFDLPVDKIQTRKHPEVGRQNDSWGKSRSYPGNRSPRRQATQSWVKSQSTSSNTRSRRTVFSSQSSEDNVDNAHYKLVSARVDSGPHTGRNRFAMSQRVNHIKNKSVKRTESDLSIMSTQVMVSSPLQSPSSNSSFDDLDGSFGDGKDESATQSAADDAPIIFLSDGVFIEDSLLPIFDVLFHPPEM